LVEGEYPDLTISLSIARQTKQISEYTKLKGLDKEKLKQMVLQFLQNSGSEGARREFIFKYLKDVLPSNKTEEQQLRIVGRLLVEMYEEGLVKKEGLRWLV
jgi:ATP-dependent DNA helicase RecG